MSLSEINKLALTLKFMQVSNSLITTQKMIKDRPNYTDQAAQIRNKIKEVKEALLSLEPKWMYGKSDDQLKEICSSLDIDKGIYMTGDGKAIRSQIAYHCSIDKKFPAFTDTELKSLCGNKARNKSRGDLITCVADNLADGKTSVVTAKNLFELYKQHHLAPVNTTIELAKDIAGTFGEQSPETLAKLETVLKHAEGSFGDLSAKVSDIVSLNTIIFDVTMSFNAEVDRQSADSSRNGQSNGIYFQIHREH